MQDTNPRTPYHSRELGRDETPSDAVVRAVAAVTGRSPARVRSVSHSIDFDSIDRLLDVERNESSSSGATVTFDICDCRIIADSTRIRIRRLAPLARS